MNVYYELIEYLKAEYLGEAMISMEEEIPQKLIDIHNRFDISVTSFNDDIGLNVIKLYNVKSKYDKLSYCFYLLPTAFLYSKKYENNRKKLVESNSIEGVFTLKKSFFRKPSIPMSVIIINNNQDITWLSTVITTDDVFELMKNPRQYHRKVYFTKKLDYKNLMPEFYNEDLNEINRDLSKYDTKNLEDIATIFNGKYASKNDFGIYGIPYLRARDLAQGMIKKTKKYILESEIDKFSNQLLQVGDILLQKNFGYHKIAKVTDSDLPAIASNGLIVIRPYGIDDNYLYTYLTSNTGKSIFDKQLKSIEKGKTITSITINDLKKIKIPTFDIKTMNDFSNLSNVSIKKVIEDITPFLRKTPVSRENHRGREFELMMIEKFMDEGWLRSEIRVEERVTNSENLAIKPDLVLYDNKTPLAAVEIKVNIASLDQTWLNKIKKLLDTNTIPFIILVLDQYYEIHNMRFGGFVKMNKAPSKHYLLSLLKNKDSV